MFGQNRSNRMPNNGPMQPPGPRPLGTPIGGPNGPIGPNFPNGPMLRYVWIWDLDSESILKDRLH